MVNYRLRVRIIFDFDDGGAAKLSKMVVIQGGQVGDYSIYNWKK
ncbi:MAG: hypothetical protein ACPG19_03225 [Saprospiraceae bacterium]